MSLEPSLRVANYRQTILLVEDCRDDIELLRRAFRKRNVAANLATAEDGDLAVQYLEGSGVYADRQLYPWPSVVLLDMKLPRRDGIEVLEWIRERFSRAEPAVIVFSSSAELEDIARAYAAGANSYVQKPSKFDGLLHVVDHLVPFWLTINLPTSET